MDKMIAKYHDWIVEHYPTKESAYLQCADATNAMIQVFPELTRVRGYYITVGAEYPHWWCVTSDGEIIDPTKKQFDFGGVYDPYDESLGEPKGKCVNCGDISYLYEFACSNQCYNILMCDLLNC